jgi:hypothetical protein
VSAERERAERLRRLLDVQSRKRRLAEWKLGELQREATALAATSAEIIESLGTQSLLNGLFLEAKASTLRRNEARIVANKAALAEAAARLLDAQGIEKRMERAVAEANVVAARREERDALAATLDDYLAAARTSLE